MREDGVRLLNHTRTLRCEVVDGEQRLVVTSGPGVHPVGAHPDQRSGGAEEALPFDLLLCAIGRRARATGFGLEALGIPLTPAGTIETNASLQTRYPNILACGDVVGPHQFTHVAAHQAWYAAVNGLFGGIKRFKVNDRVIPRVTFTDPEVAQVGLTERQAQARGIPYEVTRYGLDDLDRAITESAAQGFVKVLTVPGKDRILGACIVGEHAGELLAEFTLAMKHGLGLERILGTIHPYPTWSEAAKYAAGNWKRAHAPQIALTWLGRFHDWMRGST
ncbi:MAG: FAD-dependent oxidoreductase [Thiocapsa sp. C3-sup]|uniref:FAD-dependent oxidoreductase n=1 Tax=Thiocapsa sp. C3-sup TaxID=3137396 RepID=UPI0035B19D29